MKDANSRASELGGRPSGDEGKLDSVETKTEAGVRGGANCMEMGGNRENHLQKLGGREWVVSGSARIVWLFLSPIIGTVSSFQLKPLLFIFKFEYFRTREDEDYLTQNRFVINLGEGRKD